MKKNRTLSCCSVLSDTRHNLTEEKYEMITMLAFKEKEGVGEKLVQFLPGPET